MVRVILNCFAERHQGNARRGQSKVVQVILSRRGTRVTRAGGRTGWRRIMPRHLPDLPEGMLRNIA